MCLCKEKGMFLAVSRVLARSGVLKWCVCHQQKYRFVSNVCNFCIIFLRFKIEVVCNFSAFFVAKFVRFEWGATEKASQQ